MMFHHFCRLTKMHNNSCLLFAQRPVYHWIPTWNICHWISSLLTPDEEQKSSEYLCTVSITYSGSRWFISLGYLSEENNGYLTGFDAEYHAFWRDLFGGRTFFISDPVTGGSPIGVDFYKIIARGNEYGPFGLLEPERRVVGEGFFHCLDGETKNPTPLPTPAP